MKNWEKNINLQISLDLKKKKKRYGFLMSFLFSSQIEISDVNIIHSLIFDYILKLANG